MWLELCVEIAKQTKVWYAIFFACESSCRRSCFLGSTSTKQIYTMWLRYSKLVQMTKWMAFLNITSDLIEEHRLINRDILEIVSQEMSYAHFLVLSTIDRRNCVINKCHHPVRMSSILQQVHHVKRFFWIMLITMKHTQSLRKNNEFSRN